MSYHDDLLSQADFLARHEPRRPKQASLRRAVSAAYYALFHLLVSEGANQLAPANPPGLRGRVQRAFVHSDMKEVCKAFSSGHSKLHKTTQILINAPLELGLVAVASAFVQLQEDRHRADYDLLVPFSRIEVFQKINVTKNAFQSWNPVRKSANARVFLLALALQKQWNKG